MIVPTGGLVLENRLFYRDTWVEIDLQAIRKNVTAFNRHLHPHTKVLAVVKANGYGHGAFEVATTALEAGADRLAVASLDEAIALREKGMTAPILVFGWVRPSDAYIAVKYQLSLTVFQAEWLTDVLQHDLGEGAPPLHLHLKIDTGMHRVGVIDKGEAERMIELIQQNDTLFLEGVYTHFASADHLDNPFFDIQQKRFQDWLTWLAKKGEVPPVIHASNSAAASRRQAPNESYDYIRLGISMYGLNPSADVVPPFTLHEAFSLHSRLIHVKELLPGDTISYGATYTVTEREWIGTIPIGYGDGWLRKLAETADVLIHGERMPIVGRICMDQCMVRLPQKMKVGTKVTLIGKQGDETIPIDEIAKQLDTINYEIPCVISNRVPRVYV